MLLSIYYEIIIQNVTFHKFMVSIDTKTLTIYTRGGKISMQINETKRIESKIEVITFLEQLRYALKSGKAKIIFQKKRSAEENKDEKYTNRYTIAKLFPDKDEVDVLKRELAYLNYQDYIETIKDLDFPKRSDMRVFGKKYSNEDVYIKIRVELLNNIGTIGDNYIFILSFHFAEYNFLETDFPYRKNGGKS